MAYDEGRFVWFALMNNDEGRAKQFYGEVMPWTYSTMDMGGGKQYALIHAGGEGIAGFAPAPAPGVPNHWASYVSVEDVDAASKKVLAAGGKTLMDAFDVPEVGRIQPVADSDGAAFLLFTSAKGSDGEPISGVGSFHWNELWANNPEQVVSFYEKVLGYTHEIAEMPNGPYYMFKNGDKVRAGMMKSPVPNAPAFWLQYVHVENCDEAVERAKRNGGELQGEIMEVPGVGRFAIVKDTVGATIGFITPGKQAA